jgi:DNA-binding NarL/FixJ family response regulator
VSRFVDHLLLKMTVKQAEVLGLLLEGLTQAEVASRLSKSQSTVSSHVQALGWREVEAALRLYAEAVAKTDG